MKRKFNGFLLFTLLCASCTAPYELSQRNLASLYDSQGHKPVFRTAVFHRNDSLTTLYYSFLWSDFQYTRQENQAGYRAEIRLTVFAHPSYEAKNTADSTVIVHADSLHFGHEHWQSDSLELRMPPTPDDEIVLELVFHDLHNQEKYTDYLPVFRGKEAGQQHFLLRNPDGTPLLANHVRADQAFLVEAPSPYPGRLFVRYYRRDFPLALPPFSVDFGEPFDYAEDSLFTLSLVDGKTTELVFPQEGFYHFQSDTALRSGLTVYRFHKHFPVLSSAGELLDPLHYITTGREFQVLSAGPDIKPGIDSFWLDHGGNIERAKLQIARYYNRVQDANRLFTSYLEGWKTDRGMIYIIFGPPNHVFRATNTENWVYGEAGNVKSLRFSFIRVNNPFTYNDFSLYRNPFYKENWYNAVENWRR